MMLSLEAKDPNSVVQMKSVVGGEGVLLRHQSHRSKPTFLGVTGETGRCLVLKASNMRLNLNRTHLQNSEEQKVASTTLEIIQQQFERKCKNGLSDLQNEEMKSQIAQSMKEAISSSKARWTV